MAQQYGHATGVDKYGNPVAVHGADTTTGMAGHGPAVAGAAPAAGTGAQFQPAAGVVEQRPRGVLHRSSSSSSSEDDGMGGRRKKGIMQKIKEKLPGGHKANKPQPGTTADGTFAQPQGPVGATGAYGQQGHAGTGGVTGTYGQQGHAGMANTYGQPVQHGHGDTTDAYGHHAHAGTTGTYGQPHAGPTGSYDQQGHAGMTGPVGAHGAYPATGEKKGIMDKIKEKLPGHH